MPQRHLLQGHLPYARPNSGLIHSELKPRSKQEFCGLRLLPQRPSTVTVIRHAAMVHLMFGWNPGGQWNLNHVLSKVLCILRPAKKITKQFLQRFKNFVQMENVHVGVKYAILQCHCHIRAVCRNSNHRKITCCYTWRPPPTTPTLPRQVAVTWRIACATATTCCNFIETYGIAIFPLFWRKLRYYPSQAQYVFYTGESPVNV